MRGQGTAHEIVHQVAGGAEFAADQFVAIRAADELGDDFEGGGAVVEKVEADVMEGEGGLGAVHGTKARGGAGCVPGKDDDSDGAGGSEGVGTEARGLDEADIALGTLEVVTSVGCESDGGDGGKGGFLDAQGAGVGEDVERVGVDDGKFVAKILPTTGKESGGEGGFPAAGSAGKNDSVTVDAEGGGVQVQAARQQSGHFPVDRPFDVREEFGAAGGGELHAAIDGDVEAAAVAEGEGLGGDADLDFRAVGSSGFEVGVEGGVFVEERGNGGGEGGANDADTVAAGELVGRVAGKQRVHAEADSGRGDPERRVDGAAG